MFLEVLAIVYLVSSTDGKVDDQPTSGTPVISYIVKENRAHKVPGHPGLSCGLEPNPMHGSSECLIACLTHNNKKTLYGFGWNKNTLACRCCKKSHPSRSDMDEGWETYLPGILTCIVKFFGGRRGFHNKKSYPFLFVLNKVNVYNYLYNLKPTRRKKTKYKNYYYNYVSYKYISILRKNCNTCSLYHKLYTYWFADIKIESYMKLVQYIRCSF